MNQSLALNILSKIMSWDMDRAHREDAWLRLMSRIKYDGYQDYLAGVRFIESLADWLQQFEPAERETAYQFIRNHLVYIGPAEMQHLVELVYTETVQPRLISLVAEQFNIQPYEIWEQPEAIQTYKLFLRKTLFLGLSDGARIDAFRRANAGVISNEQVVVATQINHDKWTSLLKKLRKDLKNQKAQFSCIYLLDDFMASGKTFLRKESKDWDGKLYRFWHEGKNIFESHFEPDFAVCVHHYISSFRASQEIPSLYELAQQELGTTSFFQKVKFTFGTILPKDLPIDADRHKDFMKLIEKYYDPNLEDKHMQVGGAGARLGFGQCALPLVLEHNTPNNSIALLWAETESTKHHSMRPLFRRRQRHS